MQCAGKWLPWSDKAVWAMRDVTCKVCECGKDGALSCKDTPCPGSSVTCTSVGMKYTKYVSDDCGAKTASMVCDCTVTKGTESTESTKGGTWMCALIKPIMTYCTGKQTVGCMEHPSCAHQGMVEWHTGCAHPYYRNGQGRTPLT